MKNHLIAALCLLSFAGAKAQTRALGSVIGNQTVISIPDMPAGYPVTAQALIYYPDDYFQAKNANKRYPLFMFLHGAGEGASQDISEVNKQSLPYLISQGLKPYGIDSTTGDTVKFIVVSPHCASCGGSYSYPQLQYVLPYLMKTYRIDTTCMWAGGLSSGGRATFSMPMGQKVGDTYWGNKLAGIMPMANGGYDDFINTLGTNLATAMKGGLSVLYTIGDQDPGYNPAGYFAYNTLMSANALTGKYYTAVIKGGTHSANVWNPPFQMNSRIWNPRHNAWDQMASTHRKAAGAPVQPLTVSAGVTQIITLPLASVTLGGSAIPSTGATISSYNWSLVSGPAKPVIVSVAGITTLVTGLLSAGTYVFQLAVTDSKGGKATSNVQVIVNPLLNQAPTANAGADQTITLPTSSVTLSGGGSDPDGSVSSYLWARVSGASNAMVVSGMSAKTQVTGLTAGTYVFSLTVTDNAGARSTDNVTVTVKPAIVANKPPVVNAGADQTITLPTSSVTLSGSGSDPDGSVSSYLWARVSGASNAMVVSGMSAKTQVTGLTAGTYVFSLTATDNSGAKSMDNVTVTVKAATTSGNTGSTGGNTPTMTSAVVNIPILGPGYAQAQAMVYYPDDYNLPANANKRYPLFIYLHTENEGLTSDVHEVSKASLPQLISQGFKAYGIDSVTKDTVKFIVVAPHAANSGGSYSYTQLQYTIPYLMSNNRVDTTCVWLGGASMGGRGVLSVPMESVALGSRLTGIMPMSTGGYDGRTDLIPHLTSCLQNGLSYIMTTGAKDDGVVGYMETYNSSMSKAVAMGHGFFRQIAGVGHTADAWTQPYLLTSRWWNGNKNAWDIMASTHKGKTAATAARAVTTNGSSLELQDAIAAEAAVRIFPNPVRDAFTLNLNNPYTGKMLIQVMDVSGAIRKEYATDKNQPMSQVMVNISGLSTGTYFVRITVGNWQTTRKIVKI